MTQASQSSEQGEKKKRNAKKDGDDLTERIGVSVTLLFATVTLSRTTSKWRRILCDAPAWRLLPMLGIEAQGKLF